MFPIAAFVTVAIRAAARAATARRLACAIASVPLLAASPVFAQVPAAGVGANVGAVETPDIPTSQFVFVGEVATDQAVIRSGPSENDYPVMKLPVGARLNVVAKRDNWLKIEPPEGAFCLVSQAFVDKAGDGTTGKIINNTATVRVGSAMVPQRMHRVPLLLEPGSSVKIVGEYQEYYKIAPPKGVYLYAQTSSVIPRQKVGDQPNQNGGVQTPGGTTPPIAGTTPPATPLANGSDAVAPETAASASTDAHAGTSAAGTITDPAEITGTGNNTLTVRNNSDTKGAYGGGVSSTAALAPATQPIDLTAIKTAQAKLGELEKQYVAASGKPLQEQPLDELATSYDGLLADPNLPPNARKVATFRSEAIKLRKETLAAYLTTQQEQEKAAQRQRELEAEQRELAQKVEETAVKRYNAIGRLTQSSLQVAGQPLYRLIDPGTNRTVVYIRPGNQPQIIAGGLNQFVAIKGVVTNDEQMRLTYITPTALDVVDPKQVNTRIFADFTPPSLATANVATSGVDNQ